MDDRFQRLGLLAGIEAVEALTRTKVAVFGLGGVGSWCAEALARSGAGKLVLVDYDTVSVTNINRQAEAVNATIGEVKARAMAKRIAEINPACETTIIAERFSRRGTFEETAAMFGIDGANYIIDAIDSLDSKLDLIETAAAAGKNFFSSMGMAKKLDPTLIRTADIWKTAGCPLARRVREGLRKRGFGGHFTAVYSAEQSRVNKTRLESGITENETPEDSFGKKAINGSVVTVTASTGMILASLVLRDVFARAGEANP